MSDYPEDCIQNLTRPWWQEDAEKTVCRGAIVRTYVQYYSLIPMELVPQRVDPERHDVALLEVRPLHADRRRGAGAAAALPVAGLPRLEGADCHIINRAKKRPCLVIGSIDHMAIERGLTTGMSKWATHEFILVAPFYGVEQKERAGFNQAFVERIKHANYSRFFWDMLPDQNRLESILRFDQIQPVGLHHQAHEHLGYRLSDEAMLICDEWLNWLIYGVDGENIRSFRELIASLE